MCLRFTILIFGLILSLLTNISTFAQEKSESLQNNAALFTPEHIAQNGLERYLDRTPQWTEDIEKLRASNSTDGSPDAILFLGSSSIRLWDSIAEDVAPFKPVRRGFGGSRFCDVAIFTPTLVRDLDYRACAIFVANDVTGSDEDKKPEEVARLARSVIASLREGRSQSIPVLFISVTATPSRFKAWPKIQEVNRELEKLSQSIEDVYFLDTSSHYLTADATPRTELFGEDQLHQNKSGYQIWGGLIRDRLQEILADE